MQYRTECIRPFESTASRGSRSATKLSTKTVTFAKDVVGTVAEYNTEPS
jgi:hypothetical protein